VKYMVTYVQRSQAGKSYEQSSVKRHSESCIASLRTLDLFIPLAQHPALVAAEILSHPVGL